ncbi:MAG: methionine adenosyltransferase [Treponema sp. CETP13]|nr:MAG: methionine adenosyltransferase [Treponema sp. CETP13]
MSEKKYLFTSESVSEGHPDKLCDQISDAVLDACLRDDPDSHVACETFSSTAMIIIGGEVTTNTYVDVQQLARDVARDIGYTDAEYGLDCDSMAVMNMIHAQSPDINQGVRGIGLDEFKGKQGAGDQGMMFGFACDETPELMPAPIMYSHKILRRATEMRKSGKLNWLRPDSKSQVSIAYEGYKPVGIDTVVVSHQHDPSIKYNDLKEGIIQEIIKPVLESTGLLTKNTKYFINPTGKFVVGGPFGDTGLTGRKIIVDTYGGMGRHGGGAFSGKDPSKVDRSAAYMARYIAKNIVAAGLATRCEIELAYAIGVPYPVSIMVETFGTGVVPDEKIEAAVKDVFDCTPAGIIKTLDLKRPIYQATAAYGHFGRSEFSWEKTDKVQALKNAIK